jgi:hypothetical protein
MKMPQQQRRIWELMPRRFSLRTGLVLFAAVSIPLGIVGGFCQDVRRQDAAHRWLTEHSRPFRYSAQSESTFTTLVARKWLSPNYAQRFEHISYRGKSDAEFSTRLSQTDGAQEITISATTSPSSLEHYFRLKGLRSLMLSGKLLEGEHCKSWQFVRKATELETLYLGNGFCSRQELTVELCRLPKLRRLIIDCNEPENLLLAGLALNVTEIELTDAGYENDPELCKKIHILLDQIASRSAFEKLVVLQRVSLRPEMLRAFCTKSKVKEIQLINTDISLESFAMIASLPELQRLVVYGANIRDEHARVLHQSRQLRRLAIGGEISTGAMKDLRIALPDCSFGF